LKLRVHTIGNWKLF